MDILLIIPVLMLSIIIMAIYVGKRRKPQNKVHFYLARDKDETLWLYLGKPIRLERDIFVSNKLGCGVPLSCRLKRLGLNEDDYKNLKCEDEPVEVFINLED